MCPMYENAARWIYAAMLNSKIENDDVLVSVQRGCPQGGVFSSQKTQCLFVHSRHNNNSSKYIHY